jgi:arylsulfatase A-like enzyme
MGDSIAVRSGDVMQRANIFGMLATVGRLVLAMCSALPLVAQEEASPQRPPHIVLFLADDLGYGDVGFHGSTIPTPRIDSLAAQGARLEQFYVQPVCSPTRAALLTGRYPMRLGLQCGVVRPWATHGLPLEERTLANALREVGYTTAICGKWHLGHASEAQLPTRRGFDLQYGLYNGAIDYFTHRRDGGHDWHDGDRASDDEGYATDLLADRAIAILAEHDKENPLFLYVPFNAPHSPLQAPKEWIEKFAGIENRQQRIYAAMVASMDAAIGRILDALTEHGFASEQTLVLFLSDNGGIAAFGSNGPFRGQKGRLYEGGIRVPAVARWTGRIEAGRVVDIPLHVTDLYPTLLRLAGAKSEQRTPLDGRDVWASITTAATAPDREILHNLTPWSGALRMGRYKLVHNGDSPANATAGPKTDRYELFDIVADPGEQRDLATAEPDLLSAMRARLEELRAEAKPPVILPNEAPAGFVVPKVWGEKGTK